MFGLSDLSRMSNALISLSEACHERTVVLQTGSPFCGDLVHATEVWFVHLRYGSHCLPRSLYRCLIEVAYVHSIPTQDPATRMEARLS